jgi:primosomal protein N'
MTEQEQIKNMAKIFDRADADKMDTHCDLPSSEEYAQYLYAAGYRKQTYGKWMVCGIFDDIFKCSVCGKEYTVFEVAEHNFCPHCGAHMSGGVVNGTK